MSIMDEVQQQLKYLGALEKKVRRLLLKDENKKAAKILKEIIDGYRGLGANRKADLLENKLKSFVKETNIKVEGIIESTTSQEADFEQILYYIESLEKKVRRRILQGKTYEVIDDLKLIISELRKLKHFEKADLLETTLNEFILELAGESKLEKREAYTPPPLQQAPSSSPSIVIPKNEKNLEILRPSPAPRPPSSSLQGSKMPPPKPEISDLPSTPPPLATPSHMPPSNFNAPAQLETRKPTIKDLPYSEEELMLKKLLELKDIIQNSKK